MNKIELHKSICGELNGLYERKNHDYGDSFGKSFMEYGMTMPCIRLEDKLNRLKSLTRKDAEVLDESIDDTLMDLANYAIMTLVERRRTDDGRHTAARFFAESDTCARCLTFTPSLGYDHPICQICEHKDGIVAMEVKR